MVLVQQKNLALETRLPNSSVPQPSSPTESLPPYSLLPAEPNTQPVTTTEVSIQSDPSNSLPTYSTSSSSSDNSLTIQVQSPVKDAEHPIFAPGGKIQGQLVLRINEMEKLKMVEVGLRGVATVNIRDPLQSTPSRSKTHTFLSLDTTLFPPSSSSSGSSNTVLPVSGGKVLPGIYTFNFEFDIPSKFRCGDKECFGYGSDIDAPLSCYFSEGRNTVAVHYWVEARLSRPSFHFNRHHSIPIVVSPTTKKSVIPTLILNPSLFPGTDNDWSIWEEIFNVKERSSLGIMKIRWDWDIKFSIPCPQIFPLSPSTFIPFRLSISSPTPINPYQKASVISSRPVFSSRIEFYLVRSFELKAPWSASSIWDEAYFLKIENIKEEDVLLESAENPWGETRLEGNIRLSELNQKGKGIFKRNSPALNDTEDESPFCPSFGMCTLSCTYRLRLDIELPSPPSMGQSLERKFTKSFPIELVTARFREDEAIRYRSSESYSAGGKKA